MSQVEYYYSVSREGKNVYCKIDPYQDIITEIGFTLNGFYRSVRNLYPQLEADIKKKMAVTDATTYHDAIVQASQLLINDMDANIEPMDHDLQTKS